MIPFGYFVALSTARKPRASGDDPLRFDGNFIIYW